MIKFSGLLLAASVTPAAEESKTGVEVFDKLNEGISFFVGTSPFLKFAAVLALAIVFSLISMRIINKVFSGYLKSKESIHIRFTEKFLRAVVILIAVFWVTMSSEITAPAAKVMFQGTAIIGAIAGFAAQSALSDVICGLMMSGSKPFEIGDRLELSDGTAGVVKDITLRHVVLRKIDTIDIIIPNSKLNAMLISNMSHGTTTRSVHLRYGISYDSDVKKALEVVRQVVMDCPYTVPGKPVDGRMEYGPVYFIAYEESSLIVSTTVYYEPEYATEMVKSEVNLRVNEALKKNGIEIPYRYINVVTRETSI